MLEAGKYWSVCARRQEIELRGVNVPARTAERSVPLPAPP
jgi:hypothetical protein